MSNIWVKNFLPFVILQANLPFISRISTRAGIRFCAKSIYSKLINELAFGKKEKDKCYFKRRKEDWFLYTLKEHFNKQRHTETSKKNQVKAKQHAEYLLFENLFTYFVDVIIQK